MVRYYLGALAAICLSGISAQDAEAISLGEFEYTNSCAQCHGASGKGDGPVAPLLKKTPSDLTTLEKDNRGIFPVANVYSIIEGGADVRLHGPRDMPLWGNRFRNRIKGDEHSSGSPQEINEYARTRILALIEYLSTLQVK